MSRSCVGVRAIFPLGLLLAGLAGCSSGGAVREETTDPAQENLQKVVGAYQQYLYKTRGRPPQRPDDLKPLLKAQGQDPDQVLRSPRDNEPFVVYWGAAMEGGEEDGDGVPRPTVLAHEKTGAGGQVFVALADGQITQMSLAELSQAPKAGRRGGR